MVGITTDLFICLCKTGARFNGKGLNSAKGESRSAQQHTCLAIEDQFGGGNLN